VRKPVCGVLATLLVLGAGALGAVPARAASAASGTSCRVSNGTMSFTPTLPKLGNSSKVFPRLSISGSVSDCTGGGVSSGQLGITTPTSKTGMNCATLAAYSATPISGTEVIVWNSGSTSTIALKIVDVKTSPTMERLQGTVTSGLYKGQKESGLIQYSLPTGGCTKSGFSSASYRLVNPLTIK